MSIKNLLRTKTIVQQVNALKVKYKEWDVYFDAVQLTAKGKLRPTPRSEMYEVKILMNIKKGGSMKVKILNPPLTKNFRGDSIPHMYSQEDLCLYMPKYQEFKRTDYISDTIIPWTSLWLYYYELWHITGEWLGGGEHPNT